MAHRPSSKWLDITPDSTVCDAARRSLEVRLNTVLHYLPLAAYHAEQDVEHVHRLRVSTRRAMAALELYSDFVPRKRARWVRKRLRKARRTAGEARDLDVLAARLKRDYGDRATSILQRIAEERSAVQPDIVRIAETFHRKKEFVRKSVKLMQRIHCGRSSCSAAAGLTFGTWAAGQLRSIGEHFLESVPEEHADMAALHRFRICGKALRYSIELLASASGRELRDKTYRIVEELQERLGTINDHAAARDRLRSWAVETPNSEARNELLMLAEEEVARLTAELAAWCEWWTTERKQQIRNGIALTQQ